MSKEKQYDVEMIEDFLEHLFWEYTINLYESTREQDMSFRIKVSKGIIVADDLKGGNPELIDQLHKYQVKYNTVGLMAALAIDSSGVPEDYAKKATQSFRIARAEKAKKVLAALDTLKPYLEEAFECAKSPDQIVIKKIRLLDTIDESEA